MIVYFANRNLEIQGLAGTSLREGYIITSDTKAEEVETGVASFECEIAFNKENRNALEEMAVAGNYLLRNNGEENEFYTIIESEVDTKNQNIYIYAEDAGLDLLNEIAGKYEASSAQTIETYINRYILDSGFEIGINEVPDVITKKLSWDEETTVTERLASIASKFGGYEISFSFEIRGMKIERRYVNIYEKRGKDIAEQLRLDRDINRIITKKSVANLATAFLCTGGTPDEAENEDEEPQPITLKGYTYDDGDFWVGDDGILRSREAVSKWNRFGGLNNYTDYAGHIVRSFSYDTLSQATLCTQAIVELKKAREMEVNFEIDIARLPDNIKIGDRVNIVDDAGELYLNSRILLLETSVVDQSCKATLGEHLIKKSGISDTVAGLAAKFASQAAETARAWAAAQAAKKDAEEAMKDAEAAVREAEEAKTEAENAKAEAGNATGKVNEATKAAEEAEAAAAEAQQKAAQALADAADAAASVVVAQSKAETAMTKAEEAESTASTAKTDANNAKTIADAAKLDAEKAQEDIEGLGNRLDTVSQTMTAEYARKTDLTETAANLQSQISQNAAQISSTVSRVETIDETANNAAGLANTAQAAAEAAQKKADDATADAEAAQSAAATAQEAADAADAKAAQAATDLETAKNNLAAVTSRVGATEEEIAAAERAVEAAQAAADKAKADAATAQSTANTAKENAAKAQTAAENAKKAADDAQDAVDNLAVRVTSAETKITQNSNAIELRATKTEVATTLGGYYTKTETDAKIKVEADKITSQAAEIDDLGGRMSTVEQTASDLTISLQITDSNVSAAQTTADNAAKTATNYLNYSSAGLIVGDMTASTLGRNILIDNDSVNIRKGSIVLASYSDSKIQLGINSTAASIEMCGGKGTILVTDNMGNVAADDTLAVKGRSTSLWGTDTASIVASGEDESDYSFIDVTTGYINMNVRKYMAGGNDGGMYTETSVAINSTEIYALGEEINLVGRYGITLDSNVVYIHSKGDIHLNPTSKIYSTKQIVMSNNVAVQSYKSDGTTAIAMAFLNGSNVAFFGGSGASAAASAVRLQNTNGHLYFQDYSSSGQDYTNLFYPNITDKCALGDSAHAWYRVYAKNTTIAASDRRMKENIVPLGLSQVATFAIGRSAEQIDIHSELFYRLQPVQYNFIEGNKRICYGLVAQDVIEAMAEIGIEEDELDLVHHDTDPDPETGEATDTYGIAYENLIALLIHEVQKLKVEVDTLKTTA